MINIFNRKEAVTTTDMEKYRNARDSLARNNIEFRVRTRHAHYSHMNMGKRTMRIGRENGVEYIIYVREQDYGRALAAIHSKEE